MPNLSFKKSDDAKPIAIVRGDNASMKSNKMVYISTEDVAKGSGVTLDERLVFKKLKGYKSTEKQRLFEIMQKSAKTGVDPDDLVVDDKKVKDVYEDALFDAKHTVLAPEGCKFEVMPKVPDPTKGSTRECIYVTGCSGSGKSWFTRTYCENYNRLHKGKRPIYLISTLEEDETLDNAKCKINRLSLQSLCDDPIDINNEDEVKDSLFIFDDWDTVEDEPRGGRKYATVLWGLINDILTKGRHQGITIIIISHYNTRGAKGRLLLTESDLFVIYPHGTSQHALDYLLGHHVGIKKSEIKALQDLGSRWVALRKTYPKYLVSEYTCKLI